MLLFTEIKILKKDMHFKERIGNTENDTTFKSPCL